MIIQDREGTGKNSPYRRGRELKIAEAGSAQDGVSKLRTKQVTMRAMIARRTRMISKQPNDRFMGRTSLGW